MEPIQGLACPEKLLNQTKRIDRGI